MSSSLSKRLCAARHSYFVGREHECALLKSVLSAQERPFVVLHIFGPGGVGKTTLLREFARICEVSQTPVLHLDARNLDPSPDSFLSHVQGFMEGLEAAYPLQSQVAHRDRPVLLIDTYELLTPLDNWLREEFLPQLPEQALIVLAGRYPPTTAWRVDPGWQTLLCSLSLRNLTPNESRVYLTRRAVPVLQHQAILEFTHGHPLALSIIADVFAQTRTVPVQPETSPDVVKALLEDFLEEVPSAIHRQALEACAIARLTTEALLGQLLASSDVHELFNWLRNLSFIESGPIGLFPHDLAREVLIADLRWRNPDWYTELHQRARTYYIKRLEQVRGPEQHQILFDYIFLHRDNPVIKPRFTWQQQSGFWTDTLRDPDPPLLVEMIARHEGEASVPFASHWLARQPQNVLVIRDAEQQPVGFVLMVALHQASLEDLDADPGAIACWRYLQQHAPLRKGEGATLFRFWMARDTYQVVSPIQSLIFINLVQYYRDTPGLAFTFLPCAHPEDWTEMFAYADLARLPEADFAVGGCCYGVFGHDWRIVPPSTWQDLLAQREVATSAMTLTPSQMNEPLIVLSQPEFTEAIQEALRYFNRPDVLQQNALLRSRLIVDQKTASTREERTAMLQALVQDAIESLQSSARDDKLYRALYRTYLHPAPTQEQAAELLDLPFSTYRRHLKTGIKRVADILWQQEIS